MSLVLTHLTLPPCPYFYPGKTRKVIYVPLSMYLCDYASRCCWQNRLIDDSGMTELRPFTPARPLEWLRWCCVTWLLSQCCVICPLCHLCPPSQGLHDKQNRSTLKITVTNPPDSWKGSFSMEDKVTLTGSKCPPPPYNLRSHTAAHC